MRARRIEQHLCLNCGAPLPEGEKRQSCEACRARLKLARVNGADRTQYYNAKGRERYRRYCAEHRCVWCGKPLPEGHPVKRCDACRAKGHEQYLEQKARSDDIADRLLWEFFKGDDWQKLADVVVEAAKKLKEMK